MSKLLPHVITIHRNNSPAISTTKCFCTRIAIKPGTGDTCPIAAVQHWMREANITEGRVFRRMYRGDTVSSESLSDRSVALIVKRYATKLGLDKSQFAGHSLRSGFLTSAARNKASLDKMMSVSRHKEPRTVLEYIEEVDAFENHAADGML